MLAPVDGGRVTTDAGALLLGAIDRVIGLIRRFAACFTGARHAPFVEHGVATLLTRRVIGSAPGYKDRIDHAD